MRRKADGERCSIVERITIDVLGCIRRKICVLCCQPEFGCKVELVVDQVPQFQTRKQSTCTHPGFTETHLGCSIIVIGCL